MITSICFVSIINTTNSIYFSQIQELQFTRLKCLSKFNYKVNIIIAYQLKI